MSGRGDGGGQSGGGVTAEATAVSVVALKPRLLVSQRQPSASSRFWRRRRAFSVASAGLHPCALPGGDVHVVDGPTELKGIGLTEEKLAAGEGGTTTAEERKEAWKCKASHTHTRVYVCVCV